jgi:hypothetical protein
VPDRCTGKERLLPTLDAGNEYDKAQCSAYVVNVGTHVELD